MSDDQTQILKKDGTVAGSTLFGISVRGWIAYTLVATVCFNQAGTLIAACYYAIVKQDLSLLGSQTVIGEPLYSLAVGAVGYYFGKQQSK